MNIDEVRVWSPFINKDSEMFDLSFLNAKEVTYIHSVEGKKDICYKFIVSYSLHCFAKKKKEQSEEEAKSLMYHSVKKDRHGRPIESRPFCYERYHLAKNNLCQIVENINSSDFHIKDGNGEGYVAVKIITDEDNVIYYLVAFKIFKEMKKFRIHVKSAYPVDNKPSKGGRIGFFTIAYNLSTGKALPKNTHRGKRRR